MCKYEENFESFFGEASEEEQLRMKEIAAKIGVRDNDAIWIIIYILNYFGRCYKALPQTIQQSADAAVDGARERVALMVEEETNRAKEGLSTAVIQSAEKLVDLRETSSIVQPLAWLSCGCFLLCLICFVAGAAIAGKGWGRSPFDAILAAPAGWILPVALLPMACYSGWQSVIAYGCTKERKSVFQIVGACSIIVIAILCFLRVM